jgi:hypothetical protein
MFIVRQRLGKLIPAAMNTQATIEELPFMCNGEVNTTLNIRRIVRERYFLLGPTQSYITRITGQLEL